MCQICLLAHAWMHRCKLTLKNVLFPVRERSQGQSSRIALFLHLPLFQRHSAISAPPSLSALDDDPWGQTCSSAERWKWLLNALINPRYEIFLLKVDSLDYRLWVIERETAQLWLWDFLIAEFDVYDKEPHLANCAWKKNTFNYIFSLKCGFSQTFQRTQHK